MNSANSKISDTHRQLLNLSDKIDLKRMITMLLQQILAYTMHRELENSHTKTIKLKQQF